MTLVLRPRGRGNWKTVLLQVKGWRAESLLVRRGQTIELGGIVFRIVEVGL